MKDKRTLLEAEKKRLQKELSEIFIGDVSMLGNGDAEASKWEEVHQSIFGREEEYGPMEPLEVITAAIEFSHKADIHPAFIAKVVDRELKNRYA